MLIYIPFHFNHAKAWLTFSLLFLMEVAMNKTEQLKSISLFKDLSEKELESIAALLETKKFKRNELIFAENAPGDGFYIINSGSVRISKMVGDTEETVAFLNKGDFFGEIALIDDFPRSAAALANDDCSLYFMDREEFHKMLAGNQQLSLKLLWIFLKTMGMRLRQTNDILASTKFFIKT